MCDLLGGKGRLAPGWTRARLVNELERMIRRRIRLLASLKEGRVTQGGLEVAQVVPGKEPANAVEQVRDRGNAGYEAMAAGKSRSGGSGQKGNSSVSWRVNRSW